MEKVKLPVFVASFYLLIYAFLAQIPFDWSIRLALMMFSLSPLPVIWMVIRVLRDGVESDRTFHEHFYDDVDIRRNIPKGSSN
ncbi:MAG: hypothetical protein LPK46_03145 [Bacteroidota bacterium]|nr:hypothetical protein [Bacteroidota bacterium]MDX5427149.1 hypothetical protein [Bacteroidota bacterium]MDX5447598.1 hypothetical protein [Bacteroidota bacterium]MDX5505116.1 hypothetical protein [Bacteroidota bacterium]